MEACIRALQDIEAWDMKARTSEGLAAASGPQGGVAHPYGGYGAAPPYSTPVSTTIAGGVGAGNANSTAGAAPGTSASMPARPASASGVSSSASSRRESVDLGLGLGLGRRNSGGSSSCLGRGYLFPEIEDAPGGDGESGAEFDGQPLQLSYFDQQLNEEQKQAIQAIVRNDFGPVPLIIWGPPGTGK
ncbi:hypothetical protein HK102_012330 [Quaeritorhiza haematococci]|nr:hypothetical protein HK102_012330 [Quaeritorhiza haematococci]